MVDQVTRGNVLDTQNLIGAEIEYEEGGKIYRAQIAKVKMVGTDIFLQSAALAYKNGQVWNWCHGTAIIIIDTKGHAPEHREDGTIFVSAGEPANITLYPRGHQDLVKSFKTLPTPEELAA